MNNLNKDFVSNIEFKKSKDNRNRNVYLKNESNVFDYLIYKEFRSDSWKHKFKRKT